MYIPNIPSVTTSVIDNSSIAVTLSGNRTVLMAGFSKFGLEGFTKYSDPKIFAAATGAPDLKKYGSAYIYAGAATIADNCLFYRLLPSDATFANNIINYTGNFNTYTITDKSQLLTSANDIVVSGLATNRGDGYNSIFITFSPSTAYEKMNADMYGETFYKFNFVQAEIYQQTSNGIVQMGDSVVFSLMDVDPTSNLPIIDTISGNNLFVNNIFKDANDFATLQVNENFSTEMLENSNIDIITGSNRLIVADSVIPTKYYEIKVQTYNSIVVDANGVNQMVPATRLTTVITPTAPKSSPIFSYTDTNAATQYVQLTVTNSVISTIPADAPVAGATGMAAANADYTIDGTDAFYTLSVGTDGTFKYTAMDFLRLRMYNKLINYSMRLYSGFDGANLNTNGKLNMYGTSAVGQENAKQLLVNFYNNTQVLREVLYPLYDFDYTVDWSNDADVSAAIINLADDIGMTMPLISLPLSYDPKIVTQDLANYDLITRNQVLPQSSYNTALYSGQQNKIFRTPDNLRIYMPMSYEAMVAHLRIDNTISITEPVANVTKGVMSATQVNLTYAPSSLEIETLRNAQINTVIVEPDGTYFIDQLTAYKAASKLSRINVVKVLHRLRKDIPRLLKGLIQSKETDSITQTAVTRVNTELAQWIVSPSNLVDGIFSTATVAASYNISTYKLRLTVTVNPIGTIENIDVPIIVV